LGERQRQSREAVIDLPHRSVHCAEVPLPVIACWLLEQVQTPFDVSVAPAGQQTVL